MGRGNHAGARTLEQAITEDFGSNAVAIGVAMALIWKANSRPGRKRNRFGQMEDIPRGGLPFGFRSLAKELGIATSTLQEYITRWKRIGSIQVDGKRRVGTILVLNNYEEYQSLLRGTGTITGIPITHSLTLPQPAVQPEQLELEMARAAESVSPPIEIPPEAPPQAVKELATLYNETKNELLPPVEVEKLRPEVWCNAEKRLREIPDLRIWIRAIVAMGRSHWLTGQTGGFNPATAFEFLVTPAGERDRLGKLERILAGKFEAWGHGGDGVDKRPNQCRIRHSKETPRQNQAGAGYAIGEHPSIAAALAAKAELMAVPNRSRYFKPERPAFMRGAA